MGEEAARRGIELPLPFGAGTVYYHLDRDIRITDVRVGRAGDQILSRPRTRQDTSVVPSVHRMR